MFDSHSVKMVYKVEIGEDNVPFVQQGKYRLRLDLEEIEDGYKERAIKELREDPETVSQAIERYRELIKGKQIVLKFSNR